MIEAGDELAALKVENAKLKKIRDALISRIERGMGQPNNAFSLFEVAISLDKTVRQRTLELQSALRSVEKVNEALKRAKQQADEANAVKSTFLAFVSHDLLQPLNAAKLGLSGLIESETGAPSRLLNQVDLALTSLEELIRTLLDIAKLDAGVMQPEIASFEIEQILEPLRREFEPIAAQRRLRLKAPKSSACVRSDPLMLKRVVQNLISNALRYTLSGGVLIGCRRRGDHLRIEVSDTGPGITEERRHEIFEEFSRGPTSGASGGFGLGLAIVNRLAQALDLEVELKSRVGRGSTFAISAPLELSTNVPVPVRAAAAVAPPIGFDGALILLVENDPGVAQAMDGLLRRWGCEVSLAATEREALAALEATPRVDLVIVDMHLDHGERGVDVLDRARELLMAPVPAIVVTADGSQGTAVAIAARGYRALRKPVKPAELRSLMAYLLGQSAAHCGR